tara:strand:- start:518 stop:793 length:276 start_codon:yes stop_codon:yes gene_type:complete
MQDLNIIAGYCENIRIMLETENNISKRGWSLEVYKWLEDGEYLRDENDYCEWSQDYELLLDILPSLDSFIRGEADEMFDFMYEMERGGKWC